MTGGSGYTGSANVRELVKNGHSVVIFDNFSTGHRKLSKEVEIIEGGDGRLLESPQRSNVARQARPRSGPVCYFLSRTGINPVIACNGTLAQAL